MAWAVQLAAQGFKEQELLETRKGFLVWVRAVLLAYAVLAGQLV